jgi:hypothetical protein
VKLTNCTWDGLEQELIKRAVDEIIEEDRKSSAEKAEPNPRRKEKGKAVIGSEGEETVDNEESGRVKEQFVGHGDSARMILKMKYSQVNMSNFRNV